MTYYNILQHPAGYPVTEPGHPQNHPLLQAIGVSSAAFTAMISQALNKFGGQSMQAESQRFPKIPWSIMD